MLVKNADPPGSKPQGFCLSSFGLGPWNLDFHQLGLKQVSLSLLF